MEFERAGLAFIVPLILFFLNSHRRLLTLVVIGSFIPFVTFYGAEIDDGSNVTYKTAIRLFVLGYALFAVLKSPSLLKLFKHRFYLSIHVLLILSFLSCLYSAYGLWSFIRLGEITSIFFVYALFFHILMKRMILPEIIWLYTLAMSVVIFCVLGLVVIDPLHGMHVLDGAARLGNKSLNANSLGAVSAVVVFGCLHRFRYLRMVAVRRLSWGNFQAALLFIVAVAVLLFSVSRSALIAFMVAFLVSYLLANRFRGAFRLMIYSVLVIVLITMNYDVTLNFILRGGDLADLMSGTGRLGLWVELISNIIFEMRIIGYGFLSLSNNGYYYWDEINWINAHNTYINALMYIGLPGLVIYVYFQFAIIKRLYSRFRISAKGGFDRVSISYLLSVYIILAIVGMTEGVVFGWPNPMMGVFFLYLPACLYVFKSTADANNRLSG